MRLSNTVLLFIYYKNLKGLSDIFLEFYFFTMKIKLVTNNFEQHAKTLQDLKFLKEGKVICSIVLNEKKEKKIKKYIF